MSQPGRKPDYKLSIVIDGKYYKVGAAWVNEKGTVSIQLDSFVVLPHGPQVKLMMIPYDYDTAAKANQPPK